MLVVDGLTKLYGDVRALDRCAFTVPPGRIVGFLGPNGAGKTTAMRCIFGLATPDDGTMTWDGSPVDARIRRSFGYMPEERGLYPRMRVGEQIAYFGRLSGMTPRAARTATGEWLERFGLADRAGSRLEDLSHGNQQRIQLAVSLVHRPVMAVLDEPFAGLDPLGVETMSEVLRQAAGSGSAVLFSSHQLDLVADICEEVVIVDQGKVVLAGDVERMRRESGRRHLDIWVDGMPWEGVRSAASGGGRLVAASELPDLVAKAAADGEITQLIFEPPRLDELFREAVRR